MKIDKKLVQDFDKLKSSKTKALLTISQNFADERDLNHKIQPIVRFSE